MENINKEIKVENNCSGFTMAKKIALKFLKKGGYDPMEVSGFIYVNGPTISDLLIVEPMKKNKKKKKQPKIRKCTDKEWNKYYWDFIIEKIHKKKYTKKKKKEEYYY